MTVTVRLILDHDWPVTAEVGESNQWTVLGDADDVEGLSDTIAVAVAMADRPDYVPGGRDLRYAVQSLQAFPGSRIVSQIPETDSDPDTMY